MLGNSKTREQTHFEIRISILASHLLNIVLARRSSCKGGFVLKKMLRSKKGISPILATLLLIVIAVAAVIVTYAWVMTFTGAQTQQAGVMLTQENVSWPTASTISVTIKNTGISNAKITGVYLGTSSTNLDLSVSMSPTSATINSGSTSTFTISYTWTANTRYYFKFATDTVISLEFSEKSP
jgi:flagellin-like protein